MTGIQRATGAFLAVLLSSTPPTGPLAAQGRDEGRGRPCPGTDSVAPGPEADPCGTRLVRATVLDTVILLRRPIFSPRETRGNFLLGIFNALHVTTRPYVIRQELLLEPGQPYDSALAAETARNLRTRNLFREVEVDTVRLEDGRLAARIRTLDAWSILPRLELRVASDGTVTGVFGGTETNLFGTGNVVQSLFVKSVDRDGLVLGVGLPRVSASGIGLGGTFQNLSDRTAGSWSAGRPFRALSDRWSVVASGETFRGRVFQFRSEDALRPDTVRWQRRATIQRSDGSYAIHATPRGYLRVGLSAEVRREEFFPRAVLFDPDALPVPDTVYGLLGAWAELRRAEFHTLTYFNGFTEEDQDLSRVLFVGLKLAPGGWGYRRTGVGPRVLLRAGKRIGDLLLKGNVNAQALFNGAGLDSGRVQASGTAALRSAHHQVTLLNVAGAVQEDPPPGGEVDLGFRVPPRLWEPHAFIGTRSVAVTLEHRWYARDRILDLFGVGLSGFLDYGGAWFEDQAARAGGNVGAALLIGWPLRATPIVTELSAGYLFGGGIGATRRRRFAVSLGTGLRF
ncbi:MAG: hypothetical protein ACE5HP_10345 [Gemmatimonadota bacterium]